MSAIKQTLRGFRNIWGQGDDEYDDEHDEDHSDAATPPATQRPYSSNPSSPSTGSYNPSYAAQSTPSYGGGSGSNGASSGARRLRPVPSPLRSTREKNIYTLKPKSQEDAATAADSLKAGIAVIINLEEVDRMNAVRIIDFMSGVCYALEGHAMKLGDTIFLYTPPDFDISSDETDYAENPDFFFKDVATPAGSSAAGAPQNTAQASPPSSGHVTTTQVFTAHAAPQAIPPQAMPPQNIAPSSPASSQTPNAYGAGERRSWER